MLAGVEAETTPLAHVEDVKIILPVTFYQLLNLHVIAAHIIHPSIQETLRVRNYPFLWNLGDIALRNSLVCTSTTLPCRKVRIWSVHRAEGVLGNYAALKALTRPRRRIG
jgi:hypothetical protein